MKIIIKKDTNANDFQEAINLLGNFLLQNYSNCQMLKGEFVVQLSLEDKQGKECVDNDDVYVLTNNSFINVTAKEKRNANKLAKDGWDNYYSKIVDKLYLLKKKLADDERYLENATRLKRKAVHIASRKKMYERHKAELSVVAERVGLMLHLNRLVNDNMFIKLYDKKECEEEYGYSYEVVYVFDTINGYSGYFTAKEGLQEGLPEIYIQMQKEGK